MRSPLRAAVILTFFPGNLPPWVFQTSIYKWLAPENDYTRFHEGILQAGIRMDPWNLSGPVPYRLQLICLEEIHAAMWEDPESKSMISKVGPEIMGMLQALNPECWFNWRRHEEWGLDIWRTMRWLGALYQNKIVGAGTAGTVFCRGIYRSKLSFLSLRAFWISVVLFRIELECVLSSMALSLLFLFLPSFFAFSNSHLLFYLKF